MLFGREIVVDARHGELTGLGNGDVGGKSLNVGPVAEAAGNGVRRRFIRVPYLRNDFIESYLEGVNACQTGNGARSGVCYIARSQGRRGNVPGDGLSRGIAEGLVIEEEVGLASKNIFRNERTTDRTAKTAVVVGGKSNVVWSREVILPAIGGPVVVLIVFVGRAVETAGSALRDHLHFGARGAIEIGGLTGGIYLEFLDTILRGRHHARRAADSGPLSGNTAGRVASVRGCVNAHAAVHVVGVVAAVQREVALVGNRAGNAAIRGHAGLQLNERADVTAETRQVVDGDTRDVVAHGRIHRLQLTACGLHLNHYIRTAHL